MREICESIGKAKAKLDVASLLDGQVYGLTNYVYRVNDETGAVLYKCELVTFQYKIFRNGAWSSVITEKKYMFTCPEYTSSFNVGDRTYENMRKKSFKVCKGDKKNSVFVFQKSSTNDEYVVPKYIATDVKY